MTHCSAAFWRGLAVALPVSLIMWIGIIFGVIKIWGSLR